MKRKKWEGKREEGKVKSEKCQVGKKKMGLSWSLEFGYYCSCDRV